MGIIDKIRRKLAERKYKNTPLNRHSPGWYKITDTVEPLKTAMQQMIEWLDTIKVDYSQIPTETTLKYAKELASLEKQQIIDAREDGFYTQSNGTLSDMNKSSEDYYNETFSTPNQ